MKIPRTDSKYTSITCTGKRIATAQSERRKFFGKNEEYAKQR